MAVSMTHGSFVAPGAKAYSGVLGTGGASFTSWLTYSIGGGSRRWGGAARRWGAVALTSPLRLRSSMSFCCWSICARSLANSLAVVSGAGVAVGGGGLGYRAGCVRGLFSQD